MFLRPLFGELGAMFEIWPVSDAEISVLIFVFPSCDGKTPWENDG